MVKGGVTYTYTFNAANRMLTQYDGSTTKTFLYDNNGNLKKEGTNNYFTYNGSSRMVTSTIAGQTWDLAYDCNHQRISTVTTTATSQYFSALGLALERRGGADYAMYVYSPDGRLVSITGPDGTFNYLFDGSANVVGMIKTDGTADYYGYYPFGEELGAQGTRYNPYRFATTYQEKVNGKTLYNMHMRWYSPEHGRFTQADPIGASMDYVYAGNMPSTRVDPTGLCHKSSSTHFSAGLGLLSDVPFGSMTNKAKAGGNWLRRALFRMSDPAPAKIEMATGILSTEIGAIETIQGREDRWGRGLNYVATWTGGGAMVAAIVPGLQPAAGGFAMVSATMSTFHGLYTMASCYDSHGYQTH